LWKRIPTAEEYERVEGASMHKFAIGGHGVTLPRDAG
jgi:hypothetical protein